jgi:hypothetical protein
MTLSAEPESMAMWRNRAHSAHAFRAGIERLNHVRDGHQQSYLPVRQGISGGNGH